MSADLYPELLPQHGEMLEASAISPDMAAARGYRSIETRADLERKGFSSAQRNVPGLLIPIYGVTGKIATYQFRPDEPCVNKSGKIIKYETPSGSRLVLDVPPGAREQLRDPAIPLFVTEGSKKADAAVSKKLCCVALMGVWGWRGKNDKSGTAALADWEYITLKGRAVYIAFDNDVMTKHEVYTALVRFRGFLVQRGAKVRIIYLPTGEGGAKVGLDDFLLEHSSDELLALARPDLLQPPANDTKESITAEAEATYKLARPLLEAPDLLERIEGAIRAGGYAGDRRPPMLVYFALTSRVLERPCNLAVIAPSAAGKNFAVDAAVALMPESAYHLEKAGSARALIYSGADFQHRTVIFAEADSIPDDGPAASAIRSLATDNAMTYDVVERDEETGRHETRHIEKPGPTGLITTSTRRLREQLSTRMLTVSIPDTPDHVREVLLAHAEAVNGIRPVADVAPFQALQRWLEMAGERRVTIPFANALARSVPADLIRMNRDFRQLLTMIQAVALLHQCQRERDADGRIVATIDDYRMVRERMLEVFTAVATGGVTPSMRATVEAVRSLYDGEPLTVKQVADHLKLPKNTALYRVRAAGAGGYVVNQETRKGQPAKLVLGDPLPEERPALPEPVDLEGAPAPSLPETTRPAEPAPSDRSYGESEGAVRRAVQQLIEPGIEPALCSDSDTKTRVLGEGVQRFNGDRGDLSAESPACAHRPEGEAGDLWAMGDATWGQDPRLCTCCTGPVKGELLEPDDDGRCPTCRGGQLAPENGGHLVRHALDVGLELAEEAS
ncbi:MAG: DUF3854 domain-containing protein [Chloroflexi bacterium]|nr:DUF3854 domain-containing protein [Chloroflexota bacterium]